MSKSLYHFPWISILVFGACNVHGLTEDKQASRIRISFSTLQSGVRKKSTTMTATFILRNRPTTHIKTGCGLDGDRRSERGGEEKGGRAKMLRKKEGGREGGRKSFRQRRRRRGGCVLSPPAPDGCVTSEVNHRSRSNNNSR